jgi:serine/threonine-protein kinase
MECNHCHQPAPRPEPPELPAAEEVERNVRRHLGASYQINSLLGRGGMSLVYLAREKELNRLVALKVLPLQLVLGTAAADRFSREAKIAASLDQHHIVPIYRVGTTSSFLWYTMKYVKGRSLADVLDDHGTLGLGATLDIIGQVASALHYAHRRGIVHRDIKPENVLIDEDGWVWVCDFGVAKAFGAIPLTNTGATLGTPSYMSPEQCYGQSVDGRSDQYSLAALIYRCLAGQTPFVANSLGLMIRKQCLESPKELIEVRSDLPPRVSSAVRRALRARVRADHQPVPAGAHAAHPAPDGVAPARAAAAALAAASGPPRGGGRRPTGGGRSHPVAVPRNGAAGRDRWRGRCAAGDAGLGAGRGGNGAAGPGRARR